VFGPPGRDIALSPGKAPATEAMSDFAALLRIPIWRHAEHGPASLKSRAAGSLIYPAREK